MPAAFVAPENVLISGKEIPAPPTEQELAGLLAPVFASIPGVAQMPAYRRSEILLRVAEAISKERDAFASLICEEVRKPIKEARRETDRAIFTFRWASEETKRFGGEWLPLDLDANTQGRIALVRRFPRGACLFITPFNFPLNLAVHKIAPAIAIGAPFVWKPAPQCPRTALKLGRLLAEAGWPAEACAVLPCSNEIAENLVRDERFAVLSFTGSPKVGWHLKSLAGKKHCVMELGGIGGVVVAADADLPWAAARVAWGAYYYAGQVCISVQRVFVQDKVYDRFKDLLIKNIAELKSGDLTDENTDITPLIDSKAADRVESSIQEAVSRGARILTGGKRDGNVISPTLVENASETCRVNAEEIFGPVATIEKVAKLETAFEKISKSSFGLQAGIFTRDLSAIMRAWNMVRMGAIIINDIPSFRSDAMPYGGTKDSGEGREGVRFAMEEFTEPRTLVINP